MPPQFDADAGAAPAPRWDALFEAAELPIASFSSVTPQWAPPDFADTRAAWEGTLPGLPATRVRVEAAAYRGRPVSFSVIGPWTRPAECRVEKSRRSTAPSSPRLSWSSPSSSFGAGFLARDSVRRNRADLRGAGRLTAFVLALFSVNWLVAAHHLGTVELEFVSFVRAGGGVVFGCAVLWVVYLGFAAPEPAYGRAVWVLDGPGRMISAWLQSVYVGLLTSVLVVLAFVVMRLLFRRAWLTVMVGTVFLSILQMQNVGPPQRYQRCRRGLGPTGL